MGVGVLAQSAVASYDLMLVGENPVGGQAKIWRYDPVSRRALGSFGESFIQGQVVGMTMDPSRGHVYVSTSSNRFLKFDYNTGEYLAGIVGNAPYGSLAFDSRSGVIRVGQGGGNGFDGQPGIIGDTLTTTAAMQGIFIGAAAIRRSGSDLWYAYGLDFGTPSRLARATFAAGGGGGTIDSYGKTWNGVNAHRTSAFKGNTLFGAFLDGATMRVTRAETSAAGFSSATTNVYATASVSGSLTLGGGHGDILYLQTGTQLQLLSSVDNSLIGTQTLPFGTNSTLAGMAVVIAPEPGTMIAFGVGLAALVRRRRAR